MIEGLPYDVVNKVPMTRWDGLNGSRLYLVHTPTECEAFFDLLMRQKLVACDTETTGFHWFKGDRIVGLSFGWGLDHFYIPVRHEDSCLGGVQPAQLNMDDIREDLRRFFAQTDVTTLWHNWKFDAHFYRRDGIEILTPFHDTRILWQFFDENAPGALKTIASGWKCQVMGIPHKGIVSEEANAYEKALSKWRGQEATARRKTYRKAVQDRAGELKKEIAYQQMTKNEVKAMLVETDEFKNHPYRDAKKDDVHYGFVPIQDMTKYAATDTFLTYAVYTHVMKNMSFSQKLTDLYINEIKLSRALMEAEEAGVKVDRPYLMELEVELTEEIEQLEQELLEALGPINLNSPGQLGTALVNHGCKITKRTSAGNYCTDAKVLKELKDEHPVVKKILDMRTVKKLRDTYVRSILAKLTDDDILHCQFNQNVSTGRMSSSDPNLQNIPGRDGRIRKAFISPGPDFYYVFADYSQVEVRLTAHYSRDPLLLDAYAKKQDIHTRTMCEMFGYDYEEAVAILSNENHALYKELKNLRTISKRINFGIIYGVGAPGLSEQIPRPDQYAILSKDGWVKQCQNYIDQYMEKYRGVKRFVKQSGREIRKTCVGYNYFGRPRRLPWAKADKILGRDKYWMVGRAQRQYTNFLIQGTAADLFKIAVVRVHELFEQEAVHSKIVLFVHDEIQMYIHKDELHLMNKVRKLMEDFDFIVPIVADFAWSRTSWGAKHELG